MGAETFEDICRLVYQLSTEMSLLSVSHYMYTSNYVYKFFFLHKRKKIFIINFNCCLVDTVFWLTD